MLKAQCIKVKCTLCNNDHPLHLCTGFKEKTPEQRMDLFRQNKLCFNCLSWKNLSSTCPSRKSCRDCGVKYHSLLHRNTPVGENATTARNVKLVLPGFCRTLISIQSLARTALVLVYSDGQ